MRPGVPPGGAMTACPGCAGSPTEAELRPLTCPLYASFTPWRGGRGDVKSCVSSAMFIAKRAARSVKLRRSGTCSRSLRYCRRSATAKTPFMPLYEGWSGIRGGRCCA